MFRIDDPSAVAALPTPEAAGTEGYFTEGNPGGGVPATLVRGSWLNMIQEELRAVVVAAGLSPSKTTYNQLLTAIQTLQASSRIQSVSASVASNALTVTLNPTTLGFRSATLTNGVPVTRSLGAAASLVVPSGATLGTANGVSARLALLALDNAGTVELAIVNLAGGVNLDETTLVSTTAISASASAANIIYSTTARSNVAFRVVGFVDISEAAAGTWATAPTTVQGAGGNAMTALQTVGYGQKWQDVTASRALGTVYTNTTGRPIVVNVTGNSGAGAGTMQISVGGVNINGTSTSASGQVGSAQAIVPPGVTYSATATGVAMTLNSWVELR